MSKVFQLHSVEKEDYTRIIDIWEASVRASHDFLSENDIQYFKPLILNQYLDQVELTCAKNESDEIIGFIGCAGDKLEMLFLHPESMGKGLGKLLLNYAIVQKKITKVDVNEQNHRAVSFYLRAGFIVVHRSPLDGMGKPFPILSLELKKKFDDFNSSLKIVISNK